jgi:hypothetical protein
MALPSRETIATARLMVLVALGSALIIVALVRSDLETMMLGWAILGGAPLDKARQEPAPS